MKISPLSALVLFGLAGLVGGITWIATSQGDDSVDPAKVPEPTVSTPRVVPVSPYERKLAQRLERAKRKLEKYKEEGTVLPNGEIKTKDENGTPLWVHPELVEGVGRFGEPFYMYATYKKRPAAPLLRDMHRAPLKAANAKMKRLPPGETALQFGKKSDLPAHAAAATPGGGGEGGSGGKKNDKPDGGLQAPAGG